MTEIEVIAIARGALRAEILTLGAALHRLEVPDAAGNAANVILGYRDLEDYRRAPRYYGVIAGRYANRIAGGRFSLDGVDYRLPCNDGPNNLHGGPQGFDVQDWEIVDRSAASVTLVHVSPDGSNGFPGRLRAEVHYALEEDGLAITLTATTDAPTVCNLTNHAYFNLAGEASGGTILEHLLQIPAAHYTAVDAALIPTAIEPVDGTPFDFRSPKRIGRDIGVADEQLARGQGYDHNWVLDTPAGAVRRVATLYDPASGRVLDLHSDQPGVQFYSGNYLAGGAPGTSGSVYPARAGLCLEPQRFPNSPNRRDFPSARLDPGETYRHAMAFRFRTAGDADAAFAT